jgi:Fungal specific transcription factor domain
VDAFFEEFNLYWPLLHRPSFEHAIACGLHLREESFAAVLLMVCAVTARRSQDPTLNHGPDDPNVSLWFHQIQKNAKSLLYHVGLYEAQFYFVHYTSLSLHWYSSHIFSFLDYQLTAFYLLNTPSTTSAWVPVGIGIRICQSVGAHRRKTFGRKASYAGELWKRAFW